MLKPRASRTRDIRSLDGLWTFALDDEVGDRPWESALPVTRQAPVPASYNDVFVDPRIRGHVGVVWYQRDVVVPHMWGDQRIVLRVDAATHAGTVYVDGVLVAEHEGGYTPFEADVTDHVAPGAAARVTIAVDNRLTSATIPPGMLSVDELGRQRQRYRHDFFNYAGLPRSVSLYTTPTEHIADITVGTRHRGRRRRGVVRGRGRRVDFPGSRHPARRVRRRGSRGSGSIGNARGLGPSPVAARSGLSVRPHGRARRARRRLHASGRHPNGGGAAASSS